MSKVNVLCAPPNGKNPGMASVDLAFERVAEDLGLKPTYWRLWDQSEWVDPPGGSTPGVDGTFTDHLTGLTYRLARGRLAEFLDADAIVFWGDFHHMAVYLEQTADVLHRRIGVASHAEAQELASRHLLLAGQDEDVLSRTLTFGTTLGFNRAIDYGGDYGQQLAQLLRGARGAWFRDGYSARVGELTRAPRTDTCLGADAAFLASSEPHIPGRASGLGVFIGRSAVAPETIARIGRTLASHLGEQPVWLPWGEQPAMWPMWGRKRLRLAWPELEGASQRPLRPRFSRISAVATTDLPSAPVPTAAHLFEEVARCRVVLTDTYHLAVNAWRIGTPTVLLHHTPVGSEWNVNNGGLGRDKRHDLYSQLDALPLLLSLNHRVSARDLSALAERVLDGDLRLQIHQRAAQMGDHSLSLVSASLSDLVAP